MEINTKFNLGDYVFYIGNGIIHQAKICEVRVINKYEKEKSTNITKEHIYIIYRLYKEDNINGDCINNNVIISYRGEYEAYKWFEESQIYKTEEEVLEYIRNNINYMEEEPLDNGLVKIIED